MLLQFKNAGRQGLNLRLYSIGASLFITIVSTIAIALNAPEAFIVTSTIFSALMLLAIFVICVISDVAQFKSIFSSPQGYLNLLAPVKPISLLLPRIITMAVLDLISFAVGIFGIVFISFRIYSSNLDSGSFSFPSPHLISFLLLVVMGYLYMLALISLACATAKTVLFKSRLRGIISVAIAALVNYALGWTSMLLIPFGSLGRYSIWFTINIEQSFTNPGFWLYLLLDTIKIAICLFASSKLMERGNNV